MRNESTGARRTVRVLLLVLTVMAVTIPTTAFATHVFTDVPDTHPHRGGIEYVAGTGISKGCTEDRFCPADFVTRAQMATFLGRQSGNGAIPPTVNADKVDGLDAEDLRGEPGPQGPAGPQGPQGPQGPAGPAGGVPYWTHSDWLVSITEFDPNTQHAVTFEPGAGTWLHPDMYPDDVTHTVYVQYRVPENSEACAYLRIVGQAGNIYSNCVQNTGTGELFVEEAVNLQFASGWNEYYVTYSTSGQGSGFVEGFLWSTNAPAGSPPVRPTERR